MSLRVCSAILLVVLVTTVAPAVAAPPEFNASVTGVELAPQSLAGAAIFIFNVQGEIDGQSRRGIGAIAINHDILPEVEGGSADIFGGSGVIIVGLRVYNVQVTGGELILSDDKDTPQFDDAFTVSLSADISRFGQTAAHEFLGLLDHGPFPPTIAGQLVPAP